MSSEVQGAASFIAPEILLPTKFGLEKAVPSKEADVYALGMTTYQVLTGKRPFLPRREAGVIRAVISGERPAKPENAEAIGITEAVWDLLKSCWKEDRTARASISDILRRFCDITVEAKTADSTIEVARPPLDITSNRGSIRSSGALGVLDIMHFLPNARQLEDGDFDLDELFRRLTKALVDESQWNEIQHLMGDNAVLVIECLDRVNEIRSRSWMLSSHRALDHVVRYLSNRFRYSNTFQSALCDLKTLSCLPIPPSLLLDRSSNDNTRQRTSYVQRMRRRLPRDTERRTCGGEGLEDLESGE